MSRILGILSLIATVLSFAASFAGQLDPQYAVYMLAASAAISAFTANVQGSSEPKV